MMKIQTLHNIDTEYSADSIEWCPHPKYKKYFVCGTYQLEGDNSESTSPPCRRKGRIYLFYYDSNKNLLKELYRIETAAILDMKWQNNHTPILAIANALGQVQTFLLIQDNDNNGDENKHQHISASLKLLDTIELNENFHNLLTLSLDWSSSQQNAQEQQTQSSSNRIVASDSKGDISLINFNINGGSGKGDILQKLITWSAHSFEAWICTFDKFDSNRIYTGGDDTFLHIFDTREEKSVAKIATNKSHLAGVTCLFSHPKKSNIVLSGSYDENLRVFDIRSHAQPLCNINLNGGIWRIKSNPCDDSLILCACMYHNFSIVQLSEQLDRLKIVGEYNEHASICYGADWCQHIGDDDDDDKNPHDNHQANSNKSDNENIVNSNKMIMATCSFYDHKLCISSITKVTN